MHVHVVNNTASTIEGFHSLSRTVHVVVIIQSYVKQDNPVRNINLNPEQACII
jgi:hypothetical protein